jgi:hypothetical protein
MRNNGISTFWAGFGKSRVTIHFLLCQHGGIVPAARDMRCDMLCV